MSCDSCDKIIVDLKNLLETEKRRSEHHIQKCIELQEQLDLKKQLEIAKGDIAALIKIGWQGLNDHRRSGVMCPEDCWCWDAQAAIELREKEML